MAPQAELSPALALPPDWLAEGLAGGGASADVFRARHRNLGTFAALKIVRDAGVAFGEASLLARLHRRWGPALLDAGRLGDGSAYLAVGWVDGDVLEPRGLSDAERDRTAWLVAHAVGRGLAELHASGVRHGDVKPGNVLVHGRVPRRDAAGERAATLIDLGLATEAGASARGGTPRYASPELRRGSDVGPTADLYALGILLAEVSSARCAASDEPLASLRGEGPLVACVRALTSTSPGARPSARWIADRAAEALGLRPDVEEISHARLADLRRAYLSARAAELSTADAVDPEVTGKAREWLGEAVALAARLRGARGGSMGKSRPLERARMLVSLVGASAATWGALEGTEAAFVERACALAEAKPFGAWTLSDLRGFPTVAPAWEGAAGDERAARLALELAGAFPDERATDEVERAVREGKASPTLGRLLAGALARSGAFGRASLALSGVAGDDARADEADVARRGGDRERASRLASDVVSASSTSEPARARAAAVLARLAWDRGDDAEALRLVEPFGGAQAAELRGLVAWRRGAPAGAVQAVDEALAECNDVLLRARLEGVRGMLLQARGQVDLAFPAYERAVEGARRAGAVPEEAAYLVSAASAASDAGDVGVALESSTRAALLLDRLGRPEDAARAWLARAGALATVAARHEADEAADEALARAADPRTRAFALWAKVETRAYGDEIARVAARRAFADLEDGAADDRVRAAARVVLWDRDTLSDDAIAELDAQAQGATAVARLEWWAARAATAGGDRAPMLAALLSVAETAGPIGSRGPALTAARDLAMDNRDGEAARRFETLRRKVAERLRATTPASLRDGLAELGWMSEGEERGARADEESLAPAQIAQLENIVRSLGTRDGLKPLLSQVLDAMVLWVGVERGLLLLRAPDGRLVPRIGRNLARHDLEGEQRTLSTSLARRAMETGEAIVATDAFASHGDLHASVHALKLRSVLAVPLIARGETLGVVYLDDRGRRGAFGARELSWVRLLASQAAMAIADARDQVLLRRAVRRAERAKARVETLLGEREAELFVTKEELSRAREEEGEGTRFRYDAIAGRSEPMRALLRVVDRVTTSDVPVLIVGESGTGKELIAKAMHRNGPRARRSFVSENCAAVPESLLESTLFGHVKGAFTGASQTRPGLFEMADGGTLFLDEIGEMPLAMQAKLLRVLQDGMVRPVGGERERKVDVRLVAATHRDLEAMVLTREFREDLYYRLNVVTVRIPALRERRADIPLVVQHLLEKHAGKRRVRFTRAAMERLVAFPWPGNVRQLENEVRRAIVLAPSEGDALLDVADLNPEIVRGGPEAAREAGLDLRARVDGLEAELLREALAKTQGNQTKAAELLGLSRFGLQKMMKRLKIAAK